MKLFMFSFALIIFSWIAVLLSRNEKQVQENYKIEETTKVCYLHSCRVVSKVVGRAE